MTIPPLAHGHLPPGEHRCSLSDIKYVFCPADNERRQKLFAGLTEYLGFVTTADVFDVAYIDGSFATEKSLPSDIDIVLFADQPAGQAIKRLEERCALALLSSRVRDDYGVHVMTGFPEDRRLIDWFTQVRTAERVERGMPAGFRKGLLKVSLR